MAITNHPEYGTIQQAINLARPARPSVGQPSRGNMNYFTNNRLKGKTEPLIRLDLDRVRRGEMPRLLISGNPIDLDIHDGHFGIVPNIKDIDYEEYWEDYFDSLEMHSKYGGYEHIKFLIEKEAKEMGDRKLEEYRGGRG